MENKKVYDFVPVYYSLKSIRSRATGLSTEDILSAAQEDNVEISKEDAEILSHLLEAFGEKRFIKGNLPDALADPKVYANMHPQKVTITVQLEEDDQRAAVAALSSLAMSGFMATEKKKSVVFEYNGGSTVTEIIEATTPEYAVLRSEEDDSPYSYMQALQSAKNAYDSAKEYTNGNKTISCGVRAVWEDGEVEAYSYVNPSTGELCINAPEFTPGNQMS